MSKSDSPDMPGGEPAYLQFIRYLAKSIAEELIRNSNAENAGNTSSQVPESPTEDLADDRVIHR